MSRSYFPTETVNAFLNNTDSGNIDNNSMTSNLVNILSSIIFLLTLHGVPETVFAAACSIQFRLRRQSLILVLLEDFVLLLGFSLVKPRVTFYQLFSAQNTQRGFFSYRRYTIFNPIKPSGYYTYWYF